MTPKKKGLRKVAPKDEAIAKIHSNYIEKLDLIQKDVVEMKTLLHTFLGNSRPGLFQALEAKVSSLSKIVYMGLGIFGILAAASNFIARAIWHR